MSADPMRADEAARRPRHVVVVDDDPLFLRFVVRVLESHQLRVSPAEGFAAAIKIIEGREPVDLLLTDVGLGRGSPHGVVLSNMAQLKRHRLKVILMSGSYDVRQVAEYANPVVVLQKPFAPQQLIGAVMAALEPSTAI
ncbi:MAG TPA: response regulator [Stellaceae bacterium]|nr:response regulator [Stellaceae bacterium]